MNAVFFAAPDVLNRLSQLGLERDRLLEVGARGLAAWAACTENHPLLIPGIMCWGEAVCALREYLVPLGWERSDEGNLPIVISAVGQIAITVATGDDATGKLDEVPSTKASKGPRTASAVTANRDQMQLFPELIRPSEEDLRAIAKRQTWLFLIHRDLEVRELRCELSQPINMGVDGRVDGWSERIILGSIPFDGDPVPVDRVTPGDRGDGSGIFVEIKKRAA